MAGMLMYTTDGWAGTSSSLSVDPGSLTLVGQTVGISTGNPLLFDGFDYEVGQTESSTTAEPKFVAAGWAGCKRKPTEANSFEMWTVTQAEMEAACGYTGALPGVGSRCLKIHADTVNADTGREVYLQYGNGSVANAIPADVWFQFWYFIPNVAGEVSALQKRHKLLYPTNNNYPSTSDKWLVSLSGNPYSTLKEGGTYSSGNGYPFDADQNEVSDDSETFVIMRDVSDGSIVSSTGDPTGAVGPNLQALSGAYMAANQWHLVKVHIDTSNSSSGKLEIWLRPYGGSFRKVSEWIGGVTENFTWSGFSAGGHSMMRMPSTIGWFDDGSDYYYYMDDFAMAASEADLPVY